jgi:parallel beta-helix repeat protein
MGVQNKRYRGRIYRANSLFVSKRSTTDGVVICNPIDTIEIGEEYAVTAYLLPANNMMNDNLVKFKSLNPRVCSVECGVIKGISEGTTIIRAYDNQEQFVAEMPISVITPVTQIISPSETYTVNLSSYSISDNNTNAVATTNGIIEALNYASDNNYKKIIFPNGEYLITPSVATNPMQYVIDIPSDLVVDFSDSTINIEPTDQSLTGYNMITFGQSNTCKNSKLINTKIVGDLKTHTNNAENDLNEHCVSVSFWDSENCGLEDCDLSYSPGFNIQPIVKIKDIINDMKPIHATQTEQGKFDSQGNTTEAIKWWRTTEYIDISTLKNHFAIGNPEGYQGYTALVARLYEICFYDTNKNFISKIENCLQFYRYKLPANAHYCKISFNQTNQPSGNIGGSYSSSDTVAVIYTQTEPYKCYIRNCYIHHNHDLGIAMTGGKRWILENNTFSDNGYHYGFAVNADIDYEDGWDSCNGDIIRNNIFNSTKGLILLSGINIVIHDNTFNGNKNAFGSNENRRVQMFRCYNNKYISCSNLEAYVQNECVFAKNIMKNSLLEVKDNYHANSLYTVRMFDNVYN